jgi:predicted  nucleic acid-binding Zn-ribbon protein
VSPESVDEDGTVTSPHGLDYNSLFTYAIAAIQEQQQTIEDLKSQNESQQSTIDSLVSRIKNLENK